MGKLEKIPGHAVGIEPTYDFWMILFNKNIKKHGGVWQKVHY
jgi:hypothetical protein